MPTEKNANAQEPDMPTPDASQQKSESDLEQPPEAAPAPVENQPANPPEPPVEPEVTIIPAPRRPEHDDDRQTLAQLFSELPIGAKIGMLIGLAVILTVGVLLVFLPGANKNESADGTSTAVAAFLTLTAQPTATPIGTETPRIYIIEESPTPSLTPNVTSTPIVYVVQQGDTLNSIARRYGITVEDIANANALYNINTISVGQELAIPTPGPGTSIPLPTPGPGTPTVAINTTATAPLAEIVIRGTDANAPVELRIAAGADYQSILTLNRGTLASLVAKTPDGLWYLIQLEDGYTRGWVPANAVGLIYPADPAVIPTTPQP